MSGKRQHTIPQFILRGFATSSDGKSSFVCRVFQRNTEPYKANIMKVGVQSYFYTQGDIPNVDANITQMESDFAKLLDQIKRGKQSALSNPLLPKMLAHFEMRTRCLRETLSQTTKALLDKSSEYLSEENNCKAWIKQFMRSNSEALRNMIAARMHASGWPRGLEEPMRMLIHHFGPSTIDQRPTAETLADWTSGLDDSIREKIKFRHMLMLSDPAVQEEAAKKYENLSYSILPVIDLPMILGDSIVLFRVDSRPCYKSHLTPDDNLLAVYLPLDSRNVLVGALEEPRVLPHNLREAIARCSQEFFVAAEITDPLKMLQPCIATEANVISDREVEREVNNLLFGENATLSVSFSPVSHYELKIVHSKKNRESPEIGLALLSLWGYQGFTLSLEMAESLAQYLAAASKAISLTEARRTDPNLSRQC